MTYFRLFTLFLFLNVTLVLSAQKSVFTNLSQTDKTLPNCARARGGAWATNDNPYEIGQRLEWCTGGSIPASVPMKINSSNEWGFLFYSFHDGGSHFAMCDGSVRFINASIRLRTLTDLVTRRGREVLGEF